MKTRLQDLGLTTTLFAILLLAALPLLGGCGAYDAIKAAGGGGDTSTASVMGVESSNLAYLLDFSPTLSEGWHTAPTVTGIAINSNAYSSALKAEVYADEVRTCTNRYHLAGAYSALGLVFGVTADEVDSPSWTAFRFWGDGRELTLPHYVKKGERRKVIVNVRGVQDFDLIAEGIPQTDGKVYGSTKIGWGICALLKEEGVKYITDLTPTASTGWDQAPQDGEVWINWHPYPHSLKGVLHKGGDWASCTYHLGGAYKSFAVMPGVDQDETDSNAVVSYEVWGDGQLLGQAQARKLDENLLNFSVAGVNELVLRAKVSSGASENSISIGWGMALLLENGAS